MECRLQRVSTCDGGWSDEQLRIGRAIDTYLDGRAEWMRRTFETPARDPSLATDGVAEAIVRILLRREFNYQSTGRVAHLLPGLRDRIDRCIGAGRPVAIFCLFNGGYRASSHAGSLTPSFAPNTTELMLLLQAARLQEQVRAVHPLGIAFTIVVNNGVAAWTNGIACGATAGYARRLRDMIAGVGAQHVVSVLLQSALGDFDAEMRGVAVTPAATIDPIDHGIVERFLGRTCSPDEARERIARYAVAEAAWGERLAPLIAASSAVVVRQVAHPACLSFRPFPGGATRVQNGDIGFRMGEGPVPVPFLITSRTAASRALLSVPVILPWLAPCRLQAA